MKHPIKTLFHHVILSFGIFPASIFADTRVLPEPFSLPVPFFENNLQNSPYSARINVTSMYGTWQSSYSELEIWQPIFQRWDSVFFGDLRGFKGEGHQSGASAGLGYRLLSPSQEYLWGIYGFYDYNHSSLDSPFHQVSVGSELKTLNWTGRLNYYAPIETTQYRMYNFDTYQWSAPNTNGYQNLLISAGYEQALSGGDAEVGYQFLTGLTGYAGYFYFTDDILDEAMAGPRLRVEYDLTKAFHFASSYFENFIIQAMWQNDPIQGTIMNMGVQISLPFFRRAETNFSTSLSSRMNEYVHRNVDIVSVAIPGKDKFLPYTQNGKAWEFAVVNSENELNSFLGNTTGPDAFIIEQDITISNTISLPDNIYVTGYNFEYTPGQFFTFTPQPTSITANFHGDLLVVGKNNMIHDLNLWVVPNQNNNAIVNKNYSTTGQSVGNLSITNISTNGSMAFSIADRSIDSNITLDNNVFTSAYNTSFVLNTPGFTIAIELDNGSTIDIVGINNNTFSLSTIEEQGQILQLQTKNSNDEMNIGDISQNYFYMDGINTNFAGIRITNQGTMNINGNIDYNKIIFANNSSNPSGFIFQNNPGASFVMQGVLGNNEIFFNNPINFSIGIEIDNQGSAIFIGGIMNNSVSSPKSVNLIDGFAIDNYSQMTINNFRNNIFEFTNTGEFKMLINNEGTFNININGDGGTPVPSLQQAAVIALNNNATTAEIFMEGSPLNLTE